MVNKCRINIILSNLSMNMLILLGELLMLLCTFYSIHVEINPPSAYIFKAIMKKAKEFMVDDGLDQSEAIAAAVKFRKQAIYNMINYI